MREVVRFINPYDPGKFPEDLPFDYDEVVQLGSNENPYTPSDEVRRAYLNSFSLINRYPSATYRKLKEAISEYTGFPEYSIAVGCGASELIEAICNVVVEELDRVVIPMPSYTMYAIYSMLRSASISFPVFEGYKIDPQVIAEVRPKLTFICSPNNPTGNTVERGVIEEIASASEYLVVDEAYVEFSEKGSCADLLEEFDNIIFLRSFSKFFGLAGMRVGYALCHPEIAEAIEKVRLPFAVSYPAMNTAVAAIRSRKYYRAIRDRIVAERERLLSELAKIDWLKPYPSEANFILVKVEREGLCDRLLERGIIVRDASVMGLEGEHVRITVGTREQNDRLIEALRD